MNSSWMRSTDPEHFAVPTVVPWQNIPAVDKGKDRDLHFV